ncbi:MAG: hypothetical protein WC614_11575 [bacterium]
MKRLTNYREQIRCLPAVGRDSRHRQGGGIYDFHGNVQLSWISWSNVPTLRTPTKRNEVRDSSLRSE